MNCEWACPGMISRRLDPLPRRNRLPPHRHKGKLLISVIQVQFSGKQMGCIGKEHLCWNRQKVPGANRKMVPPSGTFYLSRSGSMQMASQAQGFSVG